MIVIGEDRLCCALGRRLVEDVLGLTLDTAPIDTKGVTNLIRDLPRYARLVPSYTVLCIADCDRLCPVDWLRRNLPAAAFEDHFLLRLAVPEAESWLLADREGFADFLGVPAGRLPAAPDDEQDPKQRVVTLARRSRYRLIREEVGPARGSERPGPGYRAHLQDFAVRRWSIERAAMRSPSLERALQRIRKVNG